MSARSRAASWAQKRAIANPFQEDKPTSPPNTSDNCLIPSSKASSPGKNSAVAIGTALIVPGDEALLERIREIQDSFGSEVGVSAWNGFAMARFCAQDAARLRADMITVLARASDRALPRLWLN